MRFDSLRFRGLPLAVEQSLNDTRAPSGRLLRPFNQISFRRNSNSRAWRQTGLREPALVGFWLDRFGINITSQRDGPQLRRVLF